MWDEIELNRHVKVARRPPQESDFERLRARGIRAIIDLRTSHEPTGDALAPAVEREKAVAHGLGYKQVPVPVDAIGFDALDLVGEALAQAAKPVLVHCAAGKRAGMVALTHTCIETGVPGPEMLEMARNLDLLFGPPEQQHIFASYVDMRGQRADSGVRRKVAALEGEPLSPLLPEDVRTMRNEVLEEHHRERTPGGTVAPKPTPHVRIVPAARAPVPPSPAPSPLGTRRPAAIAELGTPAGFATGAAVLGGVLWLLDRRLLTLLLVLAGVIAGRAAVLRVRSLPEAGPEAGPTRSRADREIAELRNRVQQLAARA